MKWRFHNFMLCFAYSSMSTFVLYFDDAMMKPLRLPVILAENIPLATDYGHRPHRAVCRKAHTMCTLQTLDYRPHIYTSSTTTAFRRLFMASWELLCRFRGFISFCVAGLLQSFVFHHDL